MISSTPTKFCHHWYLPPSFLSLSCHSFLVLFVVILLLRVISPPYRIWYKFPHHHHLSPSFHTLSCDPLPCVVCCRHSIVMCYVTTIYNMIIRHNINFLIITIPLHSIRWVANPFPCVVSLTLARQKWTRERGAANTIKEKLRKIFQ